MIKKIFYWGPFIDENIATKKAIFNSATAINKYSKDYVSTIINSIGEWNEIKKNSSHNNFYDFNLNLFNNLPKFGLVKSRFSYIKIFFSCFKHLKKLLEIEKPDYLIAHLIVSLPMLLFIIFSFETKLILRISGKPKLNFIRYFFWKIASKKIYKIFCPTEETRNYLIKKNFFIEEKIYTLPDPVFYTKEHIGKKNEKNFDPKFEKKNIILIGRLTRQKNFQLFVKAYKSLENALKKYKAYIIGIGELKKDLEDLIKKYNLEKKIIILGRQENVHKYLYNSSLFIQTSLWEDPGFVLIEAALNNVSIISSNCKSGPSEILQNEEGGYLFENNNLQSLENKILLFLKEDADKILKKKIKVKKNIRKYHFFKHCILLEQYLNEKKNKIK